MMAAGRQDAWRAPDASNTPSFAVCVQLRTSSASISALLIHFATLQSRLQNDTKKNPGRWPPLDPKPRDLPTAAGDTRVDVSPEDQKCTPVQVATYSATVAHPPHSISHLPIGMAAAGRSTYSMARPVVWQAPRLPGAHTRILLAVVGLRCHRAGK